MQLQRDDYWCGSSPLHSDRSRVLFKSGQLRKKAGIPLIRGFYRGAMTAATGIAAWRLTQSRRLQKQRHDAYGATMMESDPREGLSPTEIIEITVIKPDDVREALREAGKRNRQAWGMLLLVAGIFYLLLVLVQSSYDIIQATLNAIDQGAVYKSPPVDWSAGIDEVDATALVAGGLALISALNIAVATSRPEPTPTAREIVGFSQWRNVLGSCARVAASALLAVAASQLTHKIALGLFLLGVACIGSALAAALIGRTNDQLSLALLQMQMQDSLKDREIFKKRYGRQQSLLKVVPQTVLAILILELAPIMILLVGLSAVNKEPLSSSGKLLHSIYPLFSFIIISILLIQLISTSLQMTLLASHLHYNKLVTALHTLLATAICGGLIFLINFRAGADAWILFAAFVTFTLMTAAAGMLAGLGRPTLPILYWLVLRESREKINKLEGQLNAQEKRAENPF